MYRNKVTLPFFYKQSRRNYCKKSNILKTTYKYVYNPKINNVITKFKIKERTSLITEDQYNSVDSDGKYLKIKINIGITNRPNNTYDCSEKHLISQHIKKGPNIKPDCTSGLHKDSYAVTDNYKVKEKKLGSSNLDANHAEEHLKIAQKKNMIFNVSTGKQIILLDANGYYDPNFEIPEPMIN